ncbi:MAG TPA: hypothetical protein VMU28_06770 [Terriglobales bacterium]|nr:hypothetical protein [Terriglobales bacterium]
MSTDFRKAATLLLVAIVIVALSSFAFAQKVDPLKYNVKTEVHLDKAVVQDVQDVTLPNGQHRMTLSVKSGSDLYTVSLSPKAYLEIMDATFKQGDEVQITGSKVTDSDGKTVILAREVVKGGDTLVFRDKSGEPAWTWMEKKTAEGK